MEARIVRYLAHRMPDAGDIAVDDFHQIHGGSSQETFRLRALWCEGGLTVERKLILRRAPNAGLVVGQHDLEYEVYRALAGSDVPVPAVHFLELDPVWLDRPFFIMDLCDGKPGHPYAPGDPYDGLGARVARAFWHHLGTLAAIDHRAVGLQRLRNGEAVTGFWSAELDRWEAIIAAGDTLVQPALSGAIRWLRRNPPPAPAKPAIVHGDYRSGNFLFTEDGRISAILDWEMCHIGDPMEDIAWAIDPFWPMTRHLPLNDGLAIWEAASGMLADRDALDWWRLFSAVKASAIWTTAEASFASGESKEMVIAMSALRAGHFHRKHLLALMRTLGAMG
jgi:aminoglycoside phosphotransferase (APT) family kinase protein